MPNSANNRVSDPVSGRLSTSPVVEVVDGVVVLVVDGVVVVVVDGMVVVVEVAIASTWTAATVVLFPGVGSVVGEAISTALLIEPDGAPTETVTTITMDPPSPDETVPTSQVTTPLASAHVPVSGVALTNTTPTGKVSVTTVSTAADGPAFEYAMVYVTLLPAVTGFGVPTFVIDRSASAPIDVSSLALSLSGSGSG